MDKNINDVAISKAISDEIYDYYVTALEFINSNPDYSLLKFREIVNSVVCLVAENNDLRFESERLIDRIDFLFKCQLISFSLKDDLHKVRKLGNSGVHKEYRFDGASEFHESRKKRLVSSAHEARKKVVSILEDSYCIIKNLTSLGKVELVPAGNQDYREILYKATVESCPKIKLKAGIICEAIFNEQSFQAGLIVSNNFAAHLTNLQINALGFYEAACAISANIDNYIHSHGYDLEPEYLIHANAETEALFKYANLAIDDSLGTEFNKKGMGRLKAAADRNYGPAEALYGAFLYDKNEYDKALKYLSRAEQKDETLALRTLYHAYTEGIACEVDIEKAIEYLNHAIEIGCPDSLAMLGEAHHKGVVVKKDDEKAKDLLEQSIDKGSSYGKRYFIVEFNDLAGTMANKLKAFSEELKKTIKDNKPKPVKTENKIGRNDLCHCDSGIKYKKCCINKPRIQL
jgi:hypothetical protein